MPAASSMVKSVSFEEKNRDISLLGLVFLLFFLIFFGGVFHYLSWEIPITFLVRQRYGCFPIW